MQTQEFTLLNGRVLTVGQREDGVYAVLDDQLLAGPLAEKHVRIRTTIDLPGGGGRIGLRLQHDGSFEVLHDGRQIAEKGTPYEASSEITKPTRTLFIIAVLNFLLFGIADRWPELGIWAGPYLISGMIMLGLTLWAFFVPKHAWMPFGAAIGLYILDSVVLVAQGYAPRGLVVKAIIIASLWHGYTASRSDSRERRDLKRAYA